MRVQYTINEDISFVLLEDGTVYLDIHGTTAGLTMSDLLHVTSELQRLSQAKKPTLEALKAPVAAPEGMAWHCPFHDQIVAESEIQRDKQGVRRHLAEPKCDARLEERVA